MKRVSHVSPAYEWEQTLKEVTVYVPLSEGTRGRDVRVNIDSDQVMRITLKGEVYMEGKLHERVKRDDLIWEIVDQSELVIELSKVKGMGWWSRVMEGHTEIDTTQIEPSESKLGDLDEETQRMVKKMQVEQHQQRNQQKILEDFMSSHPELDFSAVTGRP